PILLPPQHPPHVPGAASAVTFRDCHLRLAGANFPSRIAALARKCAWKVNLMAGTISTEKIDLLIYGPMRPILENGFSDQFVVHSAETRADLERLTADTVAKLRGMAVTYHTVAANKESLARFPKLEMIASFGVGYDHVHTAHAREPNIMVTQTPHRPTRTDP